MENKNRNTIVFVDGKEVDCSKMFCGGVMINKLIDLK